MTIPGMPWSYGVMGATAPAPLTSVCLVPALLQAAKAPGCESPPLWGSLGVPQKGIFLGQDIGVLHC